MKAICPQCNMQYEVENDLQKDTSQTLCPTCKVALSFEQSGQPSLDLDQSTGDDSQQTETNPTTSTSDEATFETPVWDVSTNQPEKDEPAPEAPDQHSGSEQVDQPDNVVENQPTTEEMSPSSDNQDATEEVPTNMEDWAEAAARWATSGFSVDKMPDFVKNEDESKSSENLDDQTTDQQDQEDVPASQQSVQIDDPEVTKEKSASDESSQPEALTQDNNQAPSTEIESQIPPPIPNGLPASDEQQSDNSQEESKEQINEKTPPWQKPDEPETNQVEPASVPTFEIKKETDNPQPENTIAASLPIQATQETNPDLTDIESDISEKHSKPVFWIVLTVIMLAAGCLAAWYLADIKRFFGSENSTTAAATDSSNTERNAQKQNRKKPVLNRNKSTNQTKHVSDPKNRSTPKSDHAIETTKPKKDNETKNKDRSRHAARSKRSAAKLKRAVLYTKQGYALIKKKKYKEAVLRFKKALKADSSYPTSHRGLGICYAQLRRHKKACREYRKYLRMIPANAKEVPKLKAILKACK